MKYRSQYSAFKQIEGESCSLPKSKKKLWGFGIKFRQNKPGSPHHTWPLGSLLDDVNLAVHRFVHQSEPHCEPMVITESVMSMLDVLIPLAETHNAYLISALKTSWEVLSGKVFTIATFNAAVFDEVYTLDSVSGFEKILRWG